MSILQARAHSGSKAHNFLQALVNTYEGNVARVTSLIQTGFHMSMVPAPSIADAVADLAREDDCLLAQLCGGELHQAILSTLALDVAERFERLRADFEPDRAEVAKVVGTKLAQASYCLLSLSERIAVARSLGKDAASALCKRKIAAKVAAQRESLSDISVPLYMTRAERQANPSPNWREQSRADQKKRRAKEIAA